MQAGPPPTVSGRFSATPSRRAVRLAWAAASLAWAVTVATWALLGWNLSHLGRAALAGPIEAAAPVTVGVVGALLASRLPRNAVGWLMLSIALCTAVGGAGTQYVLHAAAADPGSLPAVRWVGWLANWAASPVYPAGLLPLLLLLFPDGRYPSRRWRPVGGLTIAAAAAFTAVTALSPVLDNLGPLDVRLPNPVGLQAFRGGATGTIGNGVVVFGVITFVAAGAAMLWRFRTSTGHVRQQLRWVVLVLVATVGLNAALIPLGLLVPPRTLYPAYELLVLLGFGLAFPAAVGVAVLRFRLYDLDLIVRRTLVYTVLTVLLGAIYVATVLLLQGALRAVTGGGSDLAVVASTLLAAAAFAPLRGWVQRFIDRRFYRVRFDAERAMRSVAASLRDEVVLERLTRTTLGTIERALQPARVSIWLRREEADGE